ncbi:MAG: gliding motility-associated ABC transporter substrate-binding protein GldG [Bacteroidia bacterium]
MLKYKKTFLELALLLVVIILVNLLSSQWFHRFDLTSDNRYTLKNTTKEILRDLDDNVYFKVYLDGDIPIGLKRMQRRIEEMLDEFRIYAGDNIQYTFINPSDPDDKDEQQALFKELRDKGLKPVNVQEKDREGGQRQKMIFPGAIVNCGEDQSVINMLKNNPGLSSEVNLNHSIEALEYELIDAVFKLTIEDKRPVAFVEGHGELDKYHVADLTNALSDYYEVDRIKLDGDFDKLKAYDAIIIAKPREEFEKQDKYLVDQYVMHGGKVLWLYEPVRISMDSVSQGQTSMARVDQLNLHDQLFKYGVRINPDLVKDLQSAVIPVNTSYDDDSPDFTPTPWLYFPLLSALNNHPVNKNLNMIKAEFASTIDTLPAYPGLEKTVMLTTSENTQVKEAPLIISLQEIEEKVNPAAYNQGRQILGVLLEGKFQSVFRNRFVSDLEQWTKSKFREVSEETSQIVISDGDLVKNEVKRELSGVSITPLGYDRYTRQTYGNKDFAINCIHYLTDKEGLIDIRGKEVQLRLLDKSKLQNERTRLQIMNVALPAILILVFGILKNLFRRRKYTK